MNFPIQIFENQSYFKTATYCFLNKEIFAFLRIPSRYFILILLLHLFIDDINSQIDTLEQWCASELTRSATLRQSILKDAFTGKLVPQDPNDEPASELLKRIQEERSVDNKAPKKKSPSTTPTRRGRPRKNKLS